MCSNRAFITINHYTLDLACQKIKTIIKMENTQFNVFYCIMDDTVLFQKYVQYSYSININDFAFLLFGPGTEHNALLIELFMYNHHDQLLFDLFVIEPSST